jgi:hypothetical protein
LFWEKNPALFEKRLRLEAKINVCEEEITILKQMAIEFTEKEQKENDTALLKDGLQGVGKLKDGILSILDGQTIDVIDDTLIISSKNSPYRGMDVISYFELVRKWKTAKMILTDKKNTLQRKLSAKQCLDEFPGEWNKVKNELYKQNPEWEKLFGLYFKNKSIPKWPDGVDNFYDKVKEEIKQD